MHYSYSRFCANQSVTSPKFTNGLGSNASRPTGGLLLY